MAWRLKSAQQSISTSDSCLSSGMGACKEGWLPKKYNKQATTGSCVWMDVYRNFSVA